MGIHQKYGIKYPFTCDNTEKMFLDVNDTYMEGVKSKVLHVIFTPKGTKIRDYEFGTDLIKYIFSPKDSDTFSEIKAEIKESVKKRVPEVDFRDIDIFYGEDDENSIIVTVEYSVTIGNKVEITTVGVKL